MKSPRMKLTRPSVLPQRPGFQVDADAAHQEIGHAAQNGARERNHQDREQGEIEMTLVIDVDPPRGEAGEIAAVRYDDDCSGLLRRRQVRGKKEKTKRDRLR